MKDQYFGDRTDYIKHCLLSHLSASGHTLAIHWNRTRDDESRDGRHTAYLKDTAKWRQYNAAIFDAIKSSVERGQRELSLFEKLGFIANGRYCYDLWCEDPSGRRASVERFTSTLCSEDVVFFDPDNGIEVKSITASARGSSKYVFFEELDIAWRKGHNLIVYQHFPRANRIDFLEAKISAIFRRMRQASTIMALATSHAAFMVIQKDDPPGDLQSDIVTFCSRWTPHVLLYTMNRGDVRLTENQMEEAGAWQLELPL